jgi:HTH-type transcriptional regulator, global nitrogen regulator NrpRI
VGFGTDDDVEIKFITIMKILRDSPEVLGSRVISQRLKNYGISLEERTVRYHLKSMDDRGFTRLLGRDGRLLTDLGIEEVENALVKYKVGFALSRIDTLAFRASFDSEKRSGLVPVNVTFFPRFAFKEAIAAMKPVFEKRICTSNLAATASEGETLGELLVPKGKIGFATVCSVVINSTLLKAGIPVSSRFSGILEIRNNVPFRFAELIEYAGCSLDPSEVFIKARMTSLRNVIGKGRGRLLATYREIPEYCRTSAELATNKLKSAGMGGVLAICSNSESVCEITVEPNRIGMILYNGLNPIAAAVESGIELENHGMSTVMEYKQLKRFEEL